MELISIVDIKEISIDPIFFTINNFDPEYLFAVSFNCCYDIYQKVVNDNGDTSNNYYLYSPEYEKYLNNLGYNRYLCIYISKLENENIDIEIFDEYIDNDDGCGESLMSKTGVESYKLSNEECNTLINILCMYYSNLKDIVKVDSSFTITDIENME